jgi:hypothetical protein
MTEPLSIQRVRVRGLWNARHVFESEAGPQGELAVQRNAFGLIVRATWRPTQGETLTFRRDPGLLRGQFSVWTEGREWLGSALRPHFVRREIELSTPSKALRLVPLSGLRRGWRLHAPKTGELARFEAHGLGRGARVRVFRRVEPELVLFAYFLGRLGWAGSLLPGPPLAEDAAGAPGAASKA